MAERIQIRVIPNAPRSQCVGRYADAIKIKIAALAMDGKANAELIKFLSKKLDISKSSIRIINGETARDKLVEIDSENCEERLLNDSNKM